MSVNGIDVMGKSAFDVSSMLQGPKDTFVTIKVMNNLINIILVFCPELLCAPYYNYLNIACILYRLSMGTVVLLSH